MILAKTHSATATEYRLRTISLRAHKSKSKNNAKNENRPINYHTPNDYELSQEVKANTQRAARKLFKQAMNKQFDNAFKTLKNSASWQ